MRNAVRKVTALGVNEASGVGASRFSVVTLRMPTVRKRASSGRQIGASNDALRSVPLGRRKESSVVAIHRNVGVHPRQ